MVCVTDPQLYCNACCHRSASSCLHACYVWCFAVVRLMENGLPLYWLLVAVSIRLAALSAHTYGISAKAAMHWFKICIVLYCIYVYVNIYILYCIVQYWISVLMSVTMSWAQASNVLVFCSLSSARITHHRCLRHNPAVSSSKIWLIWTINWNFSRYLGCIHTMLAVLLQWATKPGLELHGRWWPARCTMCSSTGRASVDPLYDQPWYVCCCPPHVGCRCNLYVRSGSHSTSGRECHCGKVIWRSPGWGAMIWSPNEGFYYSEQSGCERRWPVHDKMAIEWLLLRNTQAHSLDVVIKHCTNKKGGGGGFRHSGHSRNPKLP
jgi:hypothetical protein